MTHHHLETHYKNQTASNEIKVFNSPKGSIINGNKVLENDEVFSETGSVPQVSSYAFPNVAISVDQQHKEEHDNNNNIATHSGNSHR
eukprot:CAMPEP_0201567950 /NCGR_PEP_ID=MMETSP0190_2-20130828/8737_1 /ASSEMBLY_ACC=CAM_ASM_000263 /TAXON_ID=37353 /ORGANISM="Rosalina sp." /LENGTH=86 /DNA_ID=CAMNT_0047988539 /DNA_START=179 /DNA_END=436 /DNA_ORIENTATION=+